MNRLINDDCEKWLDGSQFVQTIIADPPDSIGLKYDGYTDNRPDYYEWLRRLISKSVDKCNHFWLTYYWKHDLAVSSMVYDLIRAKGLEWKKYQWVFTFGQHKESDCGNGHRTILRLSKPGQQLDTRSIAVPSARQLIYNDPRANPDGCIPLDVWNFPRVTGNSQERRAWHPTQIPTGIYCRIMRLSSEPNDTIVDLFCGTGTLFRANNGYKDSEKRNAIGIDISNTYCKHLASEHNLTIERFQ